PRGFAGKCRRNASVDGYAAVDRHREFQMNERTFEPMPRDELFIKPSGFFGKHACRYINSGVAKTVEALARNKRIWIFDRTYDTCDSSIYQCFGARRSSSVMVVGFQRNIGNSAASRISGLVQGYDFGVRFLVVFIRAFADDVAVL